MIFTITLNPALDIEYKVNHLVMGEVHRATGEIVDAGGKGFNVSRVLGVLGIPNTALGFVGGGTGDRLLMKLEKEGIANRLIRIAGDTRANFSIVGGSAGEYIKVNQSGPQITAEEAKQMLTLMSQTIGKSDLCVLSGSMPPGLPDYFFHQLLATIRLAGGGIILDTSGTALKSLIGPGIRLVKPNAEEAEELTGMAVGRKELLLAVGQKILAMGVESVVISNGGGALLALTEEGAWLANPPAIQVRNPVGAGDALVAGLTAGISQGLEFIESVRLGMACGACAAAQPGTGIGTVDEIETLRQLVQIEQVM